MEDCAALYDCKYKEDERDNSKIMILIFIEEIVIKIIHSCLLHHA